MTAKKGKEGLTAKIALCVSVVAATFSVYQWWIARAEQRKTFAIDISRKYFESLTEPKLRAVMNAARGQNLPYQELLDSIIFADHLEYVAFLANNNQIDADYLAVELKCYMAQAAQGMKILINRSPNLRESSFPELEKFSTQNTCKMPIVSWEKYWDQPK